MDLAISWWRIAGGIAFTLCYLAAYMAGRYRGFNCGVDDVYRRLRIQYAIDADSAYRDDGLGSEIVMPGIDNLNHSHASPSGRLSFIDLTSKADAVVTVTPTRLILLVAEVQKRYWGSNWNPNDPDTKTSQEKIVEWIRNEYPDISDVTAKAVEKVACPFDRSPAKRT